MNERQSSPQLLEPFDTFEDDRRLALRFVLTAQLSHLFVLNDWTLLAGTAAFWSISAARVAYLAGSVLAARAMSRARDRATLQHALVAWLVGGIALFAVVQLTRPHWFFFPLVLGAMVASTVYWLMPLTVSQKTSLALLMTATTLGMFAHMEVQGSTLAQRAVVITFVMLNVLGIFTARALEQGRARVADGLRRETAMRHQLERAIAEIRTLQAILSICMHCRRVRN